MFLKGYSLELYRDFDFNFEIVEDFGEEDGYYLFEESVPNSFLSNANTLICYFWNEEYPFDEVFDAFKNAQWKEIERMNFVGNSHEKITGIVYKK